MSKMDYDKSEPLHKPIIISIILTVVVILIMTFGIVYYFKGGLKIQIDRNEQNYGKSFDLKNLNKYENNYLNDENAKKVTIDDAINLTISDYN